MLLVGLAPLLGACPSNNPTTMDMAVRDIAMSTNPSVPTLGQQIDRMGRAGVNTALVDPFGLVAGDAASTCMVGASQTCGDKTKNAYNAEGNPANWASSFAGDIAIHLAALDGAGDACGNSFAALAGGAEPEAGTAYNTAAGALANDVLVVDTTKALGTDGKGCDTYLAVEANLFLNAGIMSCGGRTPLVDTIDMTYTLLTVGPGTALANLSPKPIITDGIDAAAKAPNNLTFPFLADPM
jgi:hypothetical protein